MWRGWSSVTINRRRQAEMGWDPTVLRKYNTTGHFRLLNQLRAELQAHPMSRLPISADDATAGRRRRGGRSVDVRPLPSYGRTRRGGGSSTPATSSGPMPSHTTASGGTAGGPSGDLARGSEVAAGSFRDRLSAVEMR